MFEGKTVVVTGAAGALGFAVYEHFMRRGARLVAVDYSDELLQKTFPEPVTSNQYLAVDLTERSSCRAGLGSVVAEGVDVLCNIAGGFAMGEQVHQTSDETWDFLMNLNTRSIINTAAVIVPTMLDQRRGKIINVAARAATQGLASMGLYTASKAAVMRLTEAMASELRDENINVNCIMPGTIDTARNRQDMPDADHSRWVPPAHLANVVGFLASEAAVAVHGAAIPVDGLS